MKSSSCNYSQCMVDQRPKFDTKKKRASHPNQVISKSGVIRPDKRKKCKYL